MWGRATTNTAITKNRPSFMHTPMLSLFPQAEMMRRGWRTPISLSIALDTFTTLAQGVLFLFFQPESPVRISDTTKSAVRIEVTEPCGHDPPCIENTVPRAPPV